MKKRLACLALLALALLLCLCSCLGDAPDTPATQPPVTNPPVTQPPATQPPATEPPVTTEPITVPPVTEPVTQPPVTEPVTQPPVTEPVTQPPVTEPVTQPPVTEPVPCTHSYQTSTTPATCTEAGSTVHCCTKCGDTWAETIPPLGHNSDKQETVKATCEAAGSTTYKCSRCGTTVKTETIPALGHNSDKKTVKDPTCTAKGTTTYSCSRCGRIMKTEEKAALGHSYGAWTVTTAPTLTKEGVRTATCSVCKATKTEKIPKLAPLKALDPTEYYGYAYLGTLPNGTAMQGAYREIVKGVEACADTIDISAFRIDQTDVLTVYMMYKLDYPQHFWLGREYRYTSDGSTVYPSYIAFDGGLDKARAAFDKAIDALLEGISGDDDEFTREEKAHDNLVNFCVYNLTGQEIEHTSYAAAVTGKAVCEGYAKAMQYLLYRCGIQCFTVNGKVQSGNHEWNIVRIGGEYYHLDVTFDDPTGSYELCSHRYFNLTTEQITENHQIVDSMNYLPIPACTATKYYYPTWGGIVLKELTVDELAAGILAYVEKHGAGDRIYLYYMGDSAEIRPFLQSKAYEAFRKVQKETDALAKYTKLTFIDPAGSPQIALLLHES